MVPITLIKVLSDIIENHPEAATAEIIIQCGHARYVWREIEINSCASEGVEYLTFNVESCTNYPITPDHVELLSELQVEAADVAEEFYNSIGISREGTQEEALGFAHMNNCYKSLAKREKLLSDILYHFTQ